MTNEKETAQARAKSYRTATKLVRGGTKRSQFNETSEAIFMNSGFVYDSAEQAAGRFKGENEGFIYSRYANPTLSMFEDRMILLEDGAEAARATASGMAAVNGALMSLLKAGDHVVAPKALFGSCLYIIETVLPRFGVNVTLIDGTDIDQWKSAINEKTACVFFETPSNPALEIMDIAAISDLAHKVGAKVIVDNVFATPVLQHPLSLGADIVVYSATKHIDGQGRCLGGIVLGSEEFVEDTLAPYLKHTGPALSPFNAWNLLKGLETLELRVDKQCNNAEKVAAFLEDHPAISRVIFPGSETHPQHALAKQQMARGGTLVTFEVEGGQEEAFSALNRLSLIDISNNLGDAKSLITHPTTTTHSSVDDAIKKELGITESMVRLSVGLEDVDDLIEDLGYALSHQTD
ncbi:O-succinylhomoserine sulfhydrylase [Sneathiella sp. HT1-7]|uniref:O-succinylhomoserine sulfhydrylase n=1 Tax=Sneathiella sp. HT1-7 TaxID=2887192 RepID=UPI001D132E60|nr:O-succinylhomoserine sulfhydrylase [Sneathiella sp. HT1-7]MCC3304169.1 O-succinylhomoserine sulfhydrylase [Sneathiella sp. HT1-7]